MKLLLFPAVALLSFSFPKHFTKNNLPDRDTAVINHVLDGSISEWPANKFELDITTGIKYAIDNDAANLYIAMIVPADRTQIKMIAQGMQIYVDAKGKKREEKGIAFPVPRSGGGFNNGAPNQNAGRQMPDMKQIRSMMGLNLLSLQLINFSDEPKDQELTMPGSAGLQYTWDDADVMYIEYGIPFTFFSDNSLNQKAISIGWKLNAGDTQGSNGQVTSVTQQVVGRSRGSGGGNPSNSQASQATKSSDDRTKEQSFWAKYTVIIPAK